MASSNSIEFVNVIFRIWGHRIPPDGLVTFTLLQTLDLQAEKEPDYDEEVAEDKDLDVRFVNDLALVRETTWLLTLDGFGTYKTFFLTENLLTDKRNRVIDVTGIKIMGLPIEAVPLLENKLLEAFNLPFHQTIGFDIETELNQVRIVHSNSQFAELFDALHQQGMMLNRIDKGNTITLPATVSHEGKPKKRNILLQKTEKGAKLYLLLDSSLSQPLLDLIAEKKGPDPKRLKRFVERTMSKFLKAALKQLRKDGYEFPDIKL